MRVSIVIPTLNEAERILTAVDSIKKQPGDFEIIVVDGGSSDHTIELARLHARVITSKPGRAVQMNAGAKQANGDVLLFLHADCTLHPKALAELRQTLCHSSVSHSPAPGGTFTLRFDSDHYLLRFYAFFSRLKFHYFHYGDQGIFVRRSIFEQLGGFKEMPLMEDIDFLQRLRQVGELALINTPVTTSARRFYKYGLVWQQLVNIGLVTAYLLGAKPEKLVKWFPANRKM